MRSNHVLPIARRLLALAGLCVLLLSGCTFSLINIPGINITTSTPLPPSGPTSTPQPSAAITFRVALPAPLMANEVLNLSVVDEVTGLALNPVNYAMQGMDTLHYSVTIPFPINTVVKYRYVRQGNLPTLEDTSADRPVRYRLYDVTGPGSVEDVVSAWSDGHFNSPNGRISGQVVDSSHNNAPLAGILVAAGGQQTVSDSSGRFNLEALPVGTHNLIAYAMDGAYQPYQQGASVVADKATLVTLSMTPASLVSVVFTVSVPGSTIQNLPIRLA